MAFKGIDFSKLMNETPEERETRRIESEAQYKRNALEFTQKEVTGRSSRSTQRLAITVTDYQGLPEFGKRNGVIVHGTKDNGERVGVLVQPLEHEDYQEFRNRFQDLEPGSRMIADGLYEQRRWKDMKGDWHNQPEFQALMPVMPASLKLTNRVDSEITIAPSAFTKQQNAASQSQGVHR